MRLRGLPVALLLAACATHGPSGEYANPENCESLVAARLADPGAEVASPPAPRRLLMPPPEDESDIAVEFVVDEHGRVIEDSIEVSGVEVRTRKYRIRDAAAEWTFEPARADGCWVPASYEFRMNPSG